MSETKLPLALRQARLSELGRAMKQAEEAYPPALFPMTLTMAGDGKEVGETEVTIADKAHLERMLTAAQINAINDDLAIYRLPDGGFILADKREHDPMKFWPQAPTMRGAAMAPWRIARSYGRG